MTHFRLHSSCVLVRGFKRSIVMDIQRGDFHYYPTDWVELLADLSNEFTPEQLPTEFLDSLKHRDCVFHYDPALMDYWDPLPLAFETPDALLCVSIEISSGFEVFLEEVIQVLDTVTCKQLTLILVAEQALTVLDKLVAAIGRTNFMSVTLDLMDYDGDRVQVWERLMPIEIEHGRALRVIVPEGVALPLGPDMDSESVETDTQSLRDQMVAGLETYLEALHHHSFFNQRIHIAGDFSLGRFRGDSMDWGDIRAVDSEGLLNTTKADGFRQYWNVTKDSSSICSDCEFRYACMDRRVPKLRHDKSWFHTVECNYNPYICKWKGEEGYHTLAECGVVCTAEEFSIDHDRIAAINAELWGE